MSKVKISLEDYLALKQIVFKYNIQDSQLLKILKSKNITTYRRQN